MTSDDGKPTRLMTVPVADWDEQQNKISRLTSDHLATLGLLEQSKEQVRRLRATPPTTVYHTASPAQIINQFLHEELPLSERCHASSDGKCCGEPAACQLSPNRHFLGAEASEPQVIGGVNCTGDEEGNCCNLGDACVFLTGQGDDRSESIREARWQLVVVRVPEDARHDRREPLTLDLGTVLPDDFDILLQGVMCNNSEWKCITLETGAIVFHVDDVDHIRIERI